MEQRGREKSEQNTGNSSTVHAVNKRTSLKENNGNEVTEQYIKKAVNTFRGFNASIRVTQL